MAATTCIEVMRRPHSVPAAPQFLAQFIEFLVITLGVAEFAELVIMIMCSAQAAGVFDRTPVLLVRAVSGLQDCKITRDRSRRRVKVQMRCLRIVNSATQKFLCFA